MLRHRAGLAAVVLTFGISLGAGGSSDAASIYDVANQFSTIQGQNGWTYGYISSGDLTLSNFTQFPNVTNNPGSYASWTIGMSSDPNVFHNSTGVNEGNSSIYLGPNAVVLGPFQGPTVVQWTAPADGTVTDLVASGEDIQACCGPRSVNFLVYIGNTQEFYQNVPGNPSGLPGPGMFPTATYSGPTDFAVTQGEKISFIAYNVDPLGNTGDNNSMQLNATITFIPEPASLALCGFGATGLFVAALRRHRTGRQIAPRA